MTSRNADMKKTGKTSKRRLGGIEVDEFFTTLTRRVAGGDIIQKVTEGT